MKTVQAVGQYQVSFNTSVGDYEVGEARMDTVDFAGNDIDKLAAEVIADDPEFPMIFERIEDVGLVGVFRDASDPDCVIAIMY